MRPKNARKQEIDEIITKLMNRRKNMCRFEAVKSGEYDILVSDHSEEIERIDDALAEAKKIELWMNPIIVGCDSLKPIPNVSESMMLEWAAEERWPKAIAISRVVSSQYRDPNMIMATMRGLLARLARPKGSGEKKSWEESVGAFQCDGVTYVWAMAWLKWCDENGFNASPVLWNAVNAHWQEKKIAEYCDQYPGAEPADITRICDMDSALKGTILFDEYCQLTDKLYQKGWDSAEAKAIGEGMIKIGECLAEKKKQLTHIKSLNEHDDDYNMRLDLATRKIKELDNEIEKIRKKIGGTSDSQITPCKPERSCADKRQIDLIEKVREQMQDQYKDADKVNRMKALRDLSDNGELRRLGFSDGNVLQKCRKQTDPNMLKRLGFSENYLKKDGFTT